MYYVFAVDCWLFHGRVFGIKFGVGGGYFLCVEGLGGVWLGWLFHGCGFGIVYGCKFLLIDTQMHTQTRIITEVVIIDYHIYKNLWVYLLLGFDIFHMISKA